MTDAGEGWPPSGLHTSSAWETISLLKPSGPRIYEARKSLLNHTPWPPWPALPGGEVSDEAADISELEAKPGLSTGLFEGTVPQTPGGSGFGWP